MASFSVWRVSVQVLGACALVLGANVPEPCCFPRQWAGVLYQQDGAYIEHQDRATYWNGVRQVWVDHVGQRVATTFTILTADSSQVKDSYMIIEDFRQKTMWKVKGSNCSKHLIATGMEDNCIPDDAVFLGSHVYGGVEAATWLSRAGNVTSRLTVSQNGCYPLTVSSLLTTNVWELSLKNYQNVTSGIHDPTVFDPPPGCPRHSTYTRH